MSDRYTRLRTSAWMDDDVMELPMIGKALWAYLIGGPQSNVAGFYKLPIKTLRTDLCGSHKDGTMLDGEDEQFNKVILPLLYGQDKLWKYDRKTSQVLIPKYLKHNKVGGPKQLTALNSQIEPLTKCGLHVCFLANVVRYAGEDALKYFNKEILVYVHEKTREQADPQEVVLYNRIHNMLYSTSQYSTVQYNTIQ